jgi:hypothetical protein
MRVLGSVTLSITPSIVLCRFFLSSNEASCVPVANYTSGTSYTKCVLGVYGVI